jgi:hypothetical protein
MSALLQENSTTANSDSPAHEPPDLRVIGTSPPQGNRPPPYLVSRDVEVLERHSQPVEMLIDGLLEKQCLAMICGSWGTGKTCVLMAIGINVSLGTPLAGQLAVKQGRVLFVGFEASPYQYAKQYRKLLKSLGLSTANVDMLMLQGQDLSSGPTWRRLRATVEEGHYDLVLLDGLKALSSADENSNTEMDPLMTRLMSLVEHGRTLVFTHHTGKPKLGVEPSKFDSRGASVIPARCDMEWRVELVGHKMTLTCMKSRGEVEPGATHGLSMNWDRARITLTYGAPEDQLRGELAEALEAAGSQGLKRAALLEVASGKHGDVKPEALDQRVERALETLKRDGKVTHEGQGKPYVWRA